MRELRKHILCKLIAQLDSTATQTVTRFNCCKWLWSDLSRTQRTLKGILLNSFLHIYLISLFSLDMVCICIFVLVKSWFWIGLQSESPLDWAQEITVIIESAIEGGDVSSSSHLLVIKGTVCVPSFWTASLAVAFSLKKKKKYNRLYSLRWDYLLT